MPPPLRILIFILVVTLVVGGGHLYLYRRLFRDTAAPRRLRQVGAAVLTLLGLSLFFARVVAMRLHNPVGDALAFFAWCWMGVALYLGLALLGSRLLLRLGAWRRSRGGGAPPPLGRR